MLVRRLDYRMHECLAPSSAIIHVFYFPFLGVYSRGITVYCAYDHVSSSQSMSARELFAQRHGNKVNRLGKPADQRKALLRALTTEVIRHGRIKTTLVRAKVRHLRFRKPERMCHVKTIASALEPFQISPALMLTTTYLLSHTTAESAATGAPQSTFVLTCSS